MVVAVVGAVVVAAMLYYEDALNWRSAKQLFQYKSNLCNLHRRRYIIILILSTITTTALLRIYGRAPFTRRLH